MVISYLQKSRDELLNQKVSLLDRISNCENEIKEHTKFIGVLEESNDPNYEVFTPRKVSGFNRQKIDELKAKLKECNITLNSLHGQLDELNQRIDEITQVINESKENYMSKPVYDSTLTNLSALIHKGELCLQLIDVDPIRCKQELVSLENGLKELLSGLE